MTSTVLERPEAALSSEQPRSEPDADLAREIDVIERELSQPKKRSGIRPAGDDEPKPYAYD